MSQRRALALLVRDRQSDVDEARAALSTAIAALQTVDEAISSLAWAFGPEMALALTMPDGPRLGAAYAAGHAARKALLLRRREACEAERVACEIDLRERATALKTMEKAEQRVVTREAEESARKDQLRLDEAATLRHSVRMRTSEAA